MILPPTLRDCRARWLLAIALLVPAFVRPATARAERHPGDCLSVERVTLFAPRDEAYIEVEASCSSTDFVDEDVLVARLEVVVGDLSPSAEEITVSVEEPRDRETVVFQVVGMESGDPVLVRILRFGRILDVHTYKVP